MVASKVLLTVAVIDSPLGMALKSLFWAHQIAHRVKVFATKPGDLIFTPEPTQWKERSSFSKLSFYLHMCVTVHMSKHMCVCVLSHTCAHMDSHTHTEKHTNK